MTRNKKIAIASGIILAIGIGIFVFQFSAPQKATGEKVRIVIGLYETTSPIKDAEEAFRMRLYEEGLIRNPFVFSIALRLKGMHLKDIEPGGYYIEKGLNTFELLEALKKPYQKWAVIPEGLRKEEIAEMMTKKLGWTEDAKENFLNYAEEGYLFPDTYLLNLDYTGKDVAKRMKSQFNEKAGKVLQEFADANIKHDTAITLASLIQREAANEEEMPLIAGIIWNRLLHDPPMKLQIDATIQYIVGEPGNWWRPIKFEERIIMSPFNTYLHEGKPPAPICNPGLAAMEAVIHDQPSDYLYYLHDSEGQIYFAKTYEEHQANIEQYLLETAAGTIKDIALSAKVITIRDEQEKEISVAITDRTMLLDKNGNKVELKDFQSGNSITAAGRWTGENTFIPSIIRKK